MNARSLLLLAWAVGAAGCHLIFPFGVVAPGGDGGRPRDGSDAGDGSNRSDIGGSPGGHICSRSMGGSMMDRVNDVAVDDQQNIYLGGDFFDRMTIPGLPDLVSKGGTDLFVASFTRDCKPRWALGLGSAASEASFTGGVVVDRVNKRLIVAATVYGPITIDTTTRTGPGQPDFVLAFLTLTGKPQWWNVLGGAGANIAQAVTVDGQGNVTVVGNTSEAMDLGRGKPAFHGSNDLFVASFDRDGTHRWIRGIGSSGLDLASDVATDGLGNVYVVGAFNGALVGHPGVVHRGALDVLLASYGPGGKLRWIKGFGSAGAERGWSVAAYKDQHVTITGSAGGPIDFGKGPIKAPQGTDAFIASYTIGGVPRWSTSYGSGASDWGSGLAVDGEGRLFVSGTHQGPMAVGGQTLKHAGGPDIFLLSLDSGGALRWTRAFGSSAEDHGLAVAVSGAGRVHLVGEMKGAIDFGGGLLPTFGWSDGFLATCWR